MQFNSEESARRYQETLVPLMFAPSARRLVEKAKLSAGAQVLDVATGTGIVARIAAEAIGSKGHVTAIDITPGMLAVARSQPAPPAAAPIEYLETAIETATLPAEAFQAAFCHQGLQFFEEPLRALRGIQQSLMREGHLYIALWHAIELHPLAGSMQRALLQCGLDDLTWFLSKAHRLGDPALVAKMLQQSGFALEHQETVEIVPDGEWHASDGTRLLAATPLAPKLASLTPEQRAELDTACEIELGRFTQNGKLELRFPATFYTARPA